jgi:2'-5' RNA ligase
MRAFIAVELPPDIQDALIRIQNKLRTTLPKIAWTKPDSLHLTLKFLGEISEDQQAAIQDIITGLTQAQRPFEIQLKTLETLPPGRIPRIIWIGTHQAPAQLKQLVNNLEDKICELGIPKEKRSWQAHITLGRIKQPISVDIVEKELNRLKDEIATLNLKFITREVILFKSILKAGGPIYSILKRCQFQDSL